MISETSSSESVSFLSLFSTIIFKGIKSKTYTKFNLRKGKRPISYLTGISQSAINDDANISNFIKSLVSDNSIGPLQNLNNAFNIEMVELEKCLVNCVIIKNNIVSNKKPKSYISKVLTVSTLEY